MNILKSHEIAYLNRRCTSGIDDRIGRHMRNGSTYFEIDRNKGKIVISNHDTEPQVPILCKPDNHTGDRKNIGWSIYF